MVNGVFLRGENLLLSQWLTFKLFGTTYLVGTIKFTLYFMACGWVRPGTDTPWVQWLISTFHRFVWAMFQEHPGKLTWNLKITQLKRNRIFQFWIPSLIFQGVWVSHQFLGTVSRGMVFFYVFFGSQVHSKTTTFETRWNLEVWALFWPGAWICRLKGLDSKIS